LIKISFYRYPDSACSQSNQASSQTETKDIFISEN